MSQFQFMKTSSSLPLAKIGVISALAITTTIIVFVYNIEGFRFGSTNTDTTDTTTRGTRTKKKNKNKKDDTNSNNENKSKGRKDENSNNNNDTDNDDNNDDNDDDEDDENCNWSDHIPPHLKREIMKEKRRSEKLSFLAMKSPMYDNVIMLTKDDQVLAKISKKKAKWYVNKGLAHYCKNPNDDNDEDGKQNDDESTDCIRIEFEPKDSSNNDIYSTADKENICVKCGRGDFHMMRHHIVPVTYRTLFPKRFKSHMSHDIVLLCGNCHLHCQQESQRRMTEIENLCRPPGSKPRYANDDKLYKVRSSALALKNWKHKIPKAQQKVHYQRVKDYLIHVKGVSPSSLSRDVDCNTDTETKDENENETIITQDQLQELIDIDYRIENPDFIPGATLVVNTIIDDHEKLGDFVRGWRRHFLETVHPRFLPDGWSVDYDVASNGP